MSAKIERDLLNHYKLTTLFPQEWPSTADEDEDAFIPNSMPDIERQSSKRSRRVSRYSGLDPVPVSKSRHSLPKETGGGSGNLVQSDEPDPLGIAPSVVQELRRRGVPVEEDLRLRNRFMLSSTTFSPSLFLSRVHQTATTDDLLRGLDYLSRSIEQKSASLKVLVESNFERFVKAKATIDNVYTEMRTQGSASTPASAATAANRCSHIRQSSKGNHNRSTSNILADPHQKNALTKESEYGVLGIKTPLVELAAKAEEVWGPALGGRDREQNLKSILSFVGHNHAAMQRAGNVRTAIRKQDHHTLVHKYNEARASVQDVQRLVDSASRHGTELSDEDIRTTIVVAKVWYDIEEQLIEFRRDSLRQLSRVEINLGLSDPDAQRDTNTALVAVLLQIGTDESPIWVWLSSWHDSLQSKISRTFERFRIDIEILRRRIANADEPTQLEMRSFLGAAGKNAHADKTGRPRIDRPQTLHFWDLLVRSLSDVLRPQGGLLGEIVAFWDHAKAYIDGRTQQPLLNAPGYSKDRRTHLYLTSEHARELQRRTVDLIALVRDCICSFFMEPPVDDISSLVSPIPITPIDVNFPRSRPTSIKFDKQDMPPPSPRRGEAWEQYAFWAPYASSLSGALYLSKMLHLVATAATDATAINIVNSNARLREQLKTMVGSVRERCIQAVCSAWDADSAKCKLLEDWSRNADRRDLTNFPARFMAFEEDLLIHVQKIMYMPDANARAGSSDVVIPPSSRLLQVVREHFVTTLYKALSGIVENAEKLKRGKDAVDDEISALMTVQGPDSGPDGSSVSSTSHRNICMLLVLSNLNHLRKDIIPQLITQFETLFSVKLTEESKKVRDVLGQIDSRLFQSYIKPSVDKLSSMVENGVSPASWLPTVPRPTNAKPYVYDVLLYLVLVHTEVSTSASSLTNHILSYLLEQVSLAILAAFKHRSNYNLAALMQATLDVELIAQTLNAYTTERAGEIQSQIYLVLDERTQDASRTKLQNELTEMKATLKRLRDGTKGQFGCFKRERRGRDKTRHHGHDGEREGSAGRGK